MNEDVLSFQQPAIQQFAIIWNYNAHVEQQNNYYGCKPEEGEAGGKFTPKEDPPFVNLKFFSAKKFNSMEGQAALRKLLQQALEKMNVNAGRDWIAIYISYHYYTGKLALMQQYVDFFADIEALLPNVLTKVKGQEQGDKRYKSYTESLSNECTKWFVDNGCLPPQNEWVSAKYRYGVDDDRKKLMQKLANEAYKSLGEIP